MGKIVIIATHVVTDVESAANRILLIREGGDGGGFHQGGALRGPGGEGVRAPDSPGEAKAVEADPDLLVGNISREWETLFVRVICENKPERYEAEPVRPGLEDVYLSCFRE